jgi:group I intron endonuclease
MDRRNHATYQRDRHPDRSLAIVIVVYCVSNTHNGKCYIGQTSQPLMTRWNHHLWNAEKGKDTRFYRAIRKYGRDTFSIVQLRQCESRHESDTFEKYFIYFFNSYDFAYGYNGTLGGDGGVPTEETRAKISRAKKGKKLSPQRIAQMSLSRIGKKHSAETRIKIAEGQRKPDVVAKKHLALSGKPKTAEHRRNIGKALKGRIISAEAREKLRLANTGKKQSAESRAKMSLAHTGMKESQETKNKKSIAAQKVEARTCR